MRYSIIICAHNAAGRIEPTLGQLAALDYPEDQFEVVLVDNCSSDDTAEFAKGIWAAAGTKVPFRVIEEQRPGLSNARWAGIRAARGEICVFCDDDNWLDRDYLQVADETFSAVGAKSILGGAARPVVSVDWEALPAFFFSYAQSLALGAQSLELEDVTVGRGWLMGAGLVVPAEALVDLRVAGFQHSLTGRTGTALSTGEDVELCYAFTLMGWRLYSQPSLLFRHQIPGNRLQLEYMKSLKRNNGEANSALGGYRRMRALLMHRPGIRRMLACGLEYLRQPSQANREALWYAVFGRHGKFRVLPVHLANIAWLQRSVSADG